MSRFMSPYDREFEEFCKAKDEGYESAKSYYEKHYISKSKVIDMLTEIQKQIKDLENPYPHDYDNILPLAQHNAFYEAKSEIQDLLEERIDEMREEK